MWCHVYISDVDDERTIKLCIHHGSELSFCQSLTLCIFLVTYIEFECTRLRKLCTHI